LLKSRHYFNTKNERTNVKQSKQMPKNRQIKTKITLIPQDSSKLNSNYVHSRLNKKTLKNLKNLNNPKIELKILIIQLL
jgi:hypothetical protein